ncbi:MAG: hypothetical protein K2X93_12200 [Candidatus Obscuribacterales bacterium]|nr:hypothetical protein [Candidatus Obscuribacterales bacterium]
MANVFSENQSGTSSRFSRREHLQSSSSDVESANASDSLISHLDEYVSPCDSRRSTSEENCEQETKKEEDKLEDKKTENKSEDKKADNLPEDKKAENKPEDKKAENKSEDKKEEQLPEDKKAANKLAEKPLSEEKIAGKQTGVNKEIVVGPEDLAQISAKLNPRFKHLSNVELEKSLLDSRDAKNLESVKDIFQELINRYDCCLTPKGLTDCVSSMEVILRALKAGKEVTDGPKDNKVLSDDKLSASRRWAFHSAIAGDMQSLDKQVQVRWRFAQFLAKENQFADAEKMAIEARDKAEVLTKPIEVNGVKVSPIELMKRESTQLVADLMKISDPEKRQDMQRMSIYLAGEDGAASSPIETNRFLAQLYLGTKVLPSFNSKGEVDGVREVRFGATSAFKVDKAYESIERARKHTKEILGIDPLDPESTKVIPGIAWLFKGLAHVLDNPEEYDLYRDKDGDGKPDLIQMHEVENIKKAIHTKGTLASVALDVGVWTLGTAAMRLSRNPKVLAGLERNLGKYAMNGKLATLLAGTTAVGGGLALRHYGYKAAVGLDETWIDSGRHTIGAFAAGHAYRALIKPSVAKIFLDEPTRIAARTSMITTPAFAVGLETVERNRLHNMLRKAQDPIENQPRPQEKYGPKEPEELGKKKKTP